MFVTKKDDNNNNTEKKNKTKKTSHAVWHLQNVTEMGWNHACYYITNIFFCIRFISKTTFPKINNLPDSPLQP